MHLSIKFSLFVLGGVLLQSLTYAIPLTNSTRGKSVERRTAAATDSGEPTPGSSELVKRGCDPMPPIGKRKIVDGEIPNAFFLSYDAANALKKEKADLLAYIKSQESCPGSDKTVANKIVTEYESKSGGGAILSGLFDRRVHAWLAKRIKGHENWSLEAVVKLKLAEVRQLQSYWGLSRLSDKEILPVQAGFNEKTLNWPYWLDNTKLGENTRIYILDTGVRGTSLQFAAKSYTPQAPAFRITDGQTFPPATGAATEDVVGHGTAVAAFAAGVSFGVAKLAIIIPFKLSNTREVNLDVLAVAINKAVDNFVAQTDSKIGVINISIEFGNSIGVSFAMSHARNKNMHVVVAAGNGDGAKGIDRCQSWVPPGDWIAVGATNLKDNIWEHSNYGKCVHLYAPGETVAKASHVADTGHSFGSGTSYAAPLVAGVIAVVAASPEGAALTTPKLMKAHVLSTLVVKDKIKGFQPAAPGKESNNLLLQHPVQHEITLPPPADGPSGGGGGGGPSDPPAGGNDDDFDDFGEFAVPQAEPGKEGDDDEFGEFKEGTVSSLLGYILSGKKKRALKI